MGPEIVTRVNFLAASDGTPLTKQYTKEPDGSITTNPYPFVRDFTSFEYSVSSLTDWLAVLEEHSKLHHCLLKGTLDRKLENESRAGHTNPNTPTHLWVLDLDFNDGFVDIDHFLSTLDPRFSETSYILHFSNSAGITGPAGLRSHILFFGAESYVPPHGKLWLQYKNLTVPELRKKVKLSANGMSLRYPLDITTLQSDKLIYIARPICQNFDDPLSDSRIKIVTKKHEFLPGKVEHINPQRITELADELVQELRKEAGIKTKKPKYTAGINGGVLLNPDVALVTGIKVARGFTYLNLNNGDSWGYYHRNDNPETLYNFKGEPPVRLQDIAPDYYKSLSVDKEENHSLIPHVFREKSRDQYYNILYNPSTREIDSLDPVQSKPRMADFLAQYDLQMPEPVEDWTIEFDPRTNDVFNERNRWVNSFKPTTYMKTDFESVPRIPTTINKILTSICGDKEMFDWFINWAAFIYQFREKTGTCPIFHGVPGTGKGLLHEKILQPLFGFEHTPKITTQQLDDSFNSWIEHAIIATWDEAGIIDNFDHNLHDKTKHLITEPHTMLRLMRQNPRKIRNFLNMIIMTNHPDPIPLEINDRRFTIAPPQMTPIDISENEIAIIEDELPIFAAYLQHYQVNSKVARTILKNRAREEMIISSANTVDAFFYNLRSGNLDYFLNFMRSKTTTTPDGVYIEFENVMRRWAAMAIKNSKGDSDTFISRDEAMAVYSYVIKPFYSPAKFKKMGDKYHMVDAAGRLNNKRLRGWEIHWATRDHELLLQLTENNVSPLTAIK